MTSTSSLGATAITVQFDLDRNIDAAANDIQAAINAASGQLPKNLPSPPTYRKVNPSDTPILILSVSSDVAPITEVDDAADNILAQQISQISGVSLVRIGGQQKPAVRIQIDPAKLVEKNLQLEDVRAQIATATVNSPKGTINGDTASLHHLRQRPADRTPSSGTTSSSPIATARRCASATSARRSTGRPTTPRRRGATASATSSSSSSSSPAPTSSRPSTGSSRRCRACRRRSRRRSTSTCCRTARTTIRASVNDVQFTLMLTIALVVMVIFVFLRSLWATIIPSVTVPLALLGACALMWVVGYSLDNLSLMALTIAVGFVVDDAIVMLENITRHIEDGDDAVRGGAEGRRRDRLHHHLDLDSR